MNAYTPAELNVLVCTPQANEAERIGATLDSQGIFYTVCRNIGEVMGQIAAGAGALLIAADAAKEKALTPLSRWIELQADWSELPVLVLTEAGEESNQAADWLKSLGNVSFLERPIRAVALTGAVRCAVRARKRQYQARAQAQERASAAEALHNSEARLVLATEMAGMAIWDHDLRSDQVCWSERHFSIFGYARPAPDAPIDPAMWRDRIHPDDRERVFAGIERARCEHSSFNLEYRIVRADDGAVRWIKPLGHFEYDTAGIPTRFLGVFHDSTDVKKDAQLLRERTVLLEAVANATTEMIYVKDREGRLVMANPSLCDVMGPYADIIGKTDLQLHPNPEHAHRIVATDERVMESNRGEVIEEKFGPSDSEITVLSTKTPLRDETGQVIGMVGVSRDLTERKRMEESLKRSEDLYRNIGDAIDYGIWIADARGKILYVSDSFLRMLGISADDESQEEAITARIHPDDLIETLHWWERSLDSGEPWDRQHRFLGADGKVHQVLSRGVAIRDSDGTISSWVGINLDIDRQKNAEQSLIEANERKDEFLATLAHELRNPLAPIRAAIKLMRVRQAQDADVIWAYDVVERQVKQLARLIDDLLDISRITRGYIELFPESVLLADVVRSAVETSLPHIQASGLELKVELPETPIRLWVDPLRLAQALSNLLNNAAKYTLLGGSVTLSAEPSQDEILIRVRDTGIGIAPELLPRVFNLFMQKDLPLDPSSGGLGIGLTLVRRFVDLLGGSVEGFSEGLGKGSEFVVRLPLPQGMPSAAGADALADTISDQHREELAYAGPRSGTDLSDLGLAPVEKVLPLPAAAPPGQRILVVDDNEDNANSLGMLLKLLDYDVRVAHDGLQAVDLAASFDPKVVLMDIGLPILDGYQAARRIRKLPGGGERTLIAVTGWGRDDDRRRSREAGYDHHLVKPIRFETLQQILETAAEKKQGSAAA